MRWRRARERARRKSPSKDLGPSRAWERSSSDKTYCISPYSIAFWRFQRVLYSDGSMAPSSAFLLLLHWTVCVKVDARQKLPVKIIVMHNVRNVYLLGFCLLLQQFLGFPHRGLFVPYSSCNSIEYERCSVLYDSRDWKYQIFQNDCHILCTIQQDLNCLINELFNHLLSLLLYAHVLMLFSGYICLVQVPTTQ